MGGYVCGTASPGIAALTRATVLQKKFGGDVGTPVVQTSFAGTSRHRPVRPIKESSDEQEYDLPLVQSRRRRSRAVLRQDVSEQQRRLGAQGAIELSRRQGWPGADGAVHRVRRAVHGSQRR